MTVINLHLDGELMDFVNSYIKRGYAASKSEVLRAGLVALKTNTPAENDERRGWQMLSEKSLKEIWTNPKDDKVWNKY